MLSKLPKIIIYFLLTVLISTGLLFFITKQSKKDVPKPNNQIESVNETGSCNNCNIILISIDDLRANELGTYGYQKKITQNIDKFSQNAIIFENAFSQAPWTLPSHASMLTGQYPQKSGVEVLNDRLPKGSTITQILKNNKYQTAAFTSGSFVDEQHGFAQGFDTFEQIQTFQDAQILTQKAADWLTNNHKNKFFLFMHYFHIHDPYSPNEDSSKSIDPNYSGTIKSFGLSQIVKLNKGSLTLPQSDLEHIKTLYDAELLEVDKALDQIFSLLTKTELTDNSIIIITSDHGEEFGEHGIWGMHSYSLYDELLHVPLIIKTPNNNQQKRISSLVEIVDIPKTLLSLLNVESPQTLDGVNLIDVADGKTLKKYVYAETSINKKEMLDNIEKMSSNINTNEFPPEVIELLKKQKKQENKTRMVRTDNFKLIRNYDGTFEFYNLKSDSLEKDNLFGKGISEEKTLVELLNNRP